MAQRMHRLLIGYSQASLERRECDNNLFLTLSEEIPSFDLAAPYFGLTQSEINAISRDCNNEKSRRLQMLWNWKSKNGTSATYLAIIKIFLKMKNISLAEVVLKASRNEGVTTDYRNRGEELFTDGETIATDSLHVRVEFRQRLFCLKIYIFL